jgi:hypothetical protein
MIKRSQINAVNSQISRAKSKLFCFAEMEPLSSEVHCSAARKDHIEYALLRSADARTIPRLVTLRSCLQSFAKVLIQDVPLQRPFVSLAWCLPPPQDMPACSSAICQCRGNMKLQVLKEGTLAMGTYCGVAHRMHAVVPESFDCDRGSD